MAEVLQHAADLAAQQGLTVKVIIFSDWVTPNVAVNEGSVEANLYEHKPFLAVAIKQRGFNLVPVAPAGDPADGPVLPQDHQSRPAARRRPGRGGQRPR